MATYTIKGRESGKVYSLEIEEKIGSPDEGFLNHFYQSDEEPEIIDGVYMVDDESIEAMFKTNGGTYGTESYVEVDCPLEIAYTDMMGTTFRDTFGQTFGEEPWLEYDVKPTDTVWYELVKRNNFGEYETLDYAASPVTLSKKHNVSFDWKDLR